MEKNKVRIQKYLSSNGVASRRKAEEMVIEGLIKINGKQAQIGDKITPGIDKVYVNGKIVKSGTERKRYIVLNKPRGYITTMHDEKDRKCVAGLISDIPERVYPVGRLDKDSEGMLIMTNDGEFANSIMHPSKHIDKTYKVTTKSKVTDYKLAKLCSGVNIGGYTTAPARVRIVEEEPGRTVMEITIHEGKNRQIRKMCEVLNLDISRLKRISIGGVKLGGLPIGKWRELRNDEIIKLKKQND